MQIIELQLTSQTQPVTIDWLTIIIYSIIALIIALIINKIRKRYVKNNSQKSTR